jgi:hypothetical protein
MPKFQRFVVAATCDSKVRPALEAHRNLLTGRAIVNSFRARDCSKSQTIE